MRATVLMLLALSSLVLVHVTVAKTHPKDLEANDKHLPAKTGHHVDKKDDEEELGEGLIPVTTAKQGQDEEDDTPNAKHGKNKEKKRRKNLKKKEKQEKQENQKEKKMKEKQERKRLRKEKRKERKEKKQLAKENKRKLECTADSECNGGCCIKRKNRKVCSKPFNRDVNNKCKRPCQCQEGLGCFVLNKKSGGKRNKKAIGSCLKPADGDLSIGHFLSSV